MYEELGEPASVSLGEQSRTQGLEAVLN
jgi:hypothetical protein